APAAPPDLPPRARRAVTDALTLTRRGLAHWRRQPAVLLVSLAFPVLLLVMFAYLLGGGIVVDGGGGHTECLGPGMFALTMAFGLETTMVALTRDTTGGYLDRLRAMPVAPSAVLVARSVLDMLAAAVGLGVMVGAGLAVGWRWHGTAAEALAALGLLL